MSKYGFIRIKSTHWLTEISLLNRAMRRERALGRLRTLRGLRRKSRKRRGLPLRPSLSEPVAIKLAVKSRGKNAYLRARTTFPPPFTSATRVQIPSGTLGFFALSRAVGRL